MGNYLISVVGPTAIGKTALSIQLARYYNTRILSADSRQFYKEMSIGTAVPSGDELAAAQHHFIQHISIEDTYSVGHFERDAIAQLSELFPTCNPIILVGGSGLYTDAVSNGLDEFPETKEGIREQLQKLFKQQGIDALQDLLKEKDPVYYKQVDLENTQRVMRALEVCISSGQSFSSFRNQPKKQRDFHTLKIGLTADRSIIYERINKRVDLMIENGLVDEVRSLLSRKHLNALQTVGYRELFEYFEGKVILERAIENIKTNTRRFAKRQLTWYRKDDQIKWFDYETSTDQIISYIDNELLKIKE